ncbi:MAG TPA: hypothetical protein VGJ77_07405 [Gaiellaceae bacterium]|jgi:hypothetical protein
MTSVSGPGNLLVGRNADGRLEVFAPGRFMSVLHAWEEDVGGGWSDWSEVPLSWTSSPPALASNDAGRLELFAATSDAVNHVWQTGGGWSAVEVLLGVRPAGRPVVGLNEDCRLEVFVCNTEGHVEHNWQREANGDWVASAGRWPTLQGLVAAKNAEPAVAANADGRLELFVRGADGDLYHAWQRYPNGGFGPWTSMDANVPGMPAVVLNGDGRLEVFAVTEGGDLLHAMQQGLDDGFGEWSVLGRDRPGVPAVGTNADGRLEVFVRGRDGALHHNPQEAPGAGFAGWQSLGGSWDGHPSVERNEDGRLEVFMRGRDGAVYRSAQEAPGEGFSEWFSLGVPRRQKAPA